MRVRVFDIPHKGIRNGLSQLLILAGKTDYTDPSQVLALSNLTDQVFQLIRLHEADENEWVLPALDKHHADSSRKDREDHDFLRMLLSDTEARLKDIVMATRQGDNASGAGAEFYWLVQKLLAKYLLHMAAEEEFTQVMLWNHYTDEELAGIQRKIIGNQPPEVMDLWFRFVIPSQTHGERTRLLSGYRNMVSRDVFDASLAEIKKVLTSEEFIRLRADL